MAVLVFVEAEKYYTFHHNDLDIPACCKQGLSPVEMRTLSTGSLIAIFPLMVLGGSTTICLFPLLYRRWMFSKYRKSIEALIADTLARQVAEQIGIMFSGLAINIRFIHIVR